MGPGPAHSPVAPTHRVWHQMPPIRVHLAYGGVAHRLLRLTVVQKGELPTLVQLFHRWSELVENVKVLNQFSVNE